MRCMLKSLKYQIMQCKEAYPCFFKTERIFVFHVKKVTLLWTLLAAFFLGCCIPGLDSKTFYCDPEEKVITIASSPELSSGVIRTLGEGDIYYDNSLACTWLLDAGEDEATSRMVHIGVVNSVLQWAPETAICQSYDYIQIRDGQHDTNDTIVTWCGHQNPRSIMSSDRYLRINFRSNDRNVYDYTGATLNFTFFGTSSSRESCPPGWFDHPTLPNGGEYCYGIKMQEETWTDAQVHCGYDQSNLASIHSDVIQDLFIEQLKYEPGVMDDDMLWIGLNDIEEEGQYEWVDRSDTTGFLKWRTEPQRPDQYHNCISMAARDGTWEEDFCNENDIKTLVKHKYICQKQKLGRTTVHLVPRERSEKGGESAFKGSIVWIILGIVGGFIIILGLVIFFAVRHTLKKKRSKHRQTYSASGALNASSGAVSRDRSQSRNQPDQRPPPTAPTASDDEHQSVLIIEPPPSYDEVVHRK